MIWEIINPSDQYTIESDNFLAACLATCLLGEGKYALKPLDKGNQKSMPIFLFGGHDEWFQKEFGTDFENAFDRIDVLALADVLDSVLIGDMQDRATYNDGLRLIDDPQKRQEWREKWLDDRRSSLNNIGGRADDYAKQMRAKHSKAVPA